MCDTSLGSFGYKVKDRGTCCLGPSTSRCGHGNQRFQWLTNWKALAQRGINKVEELGIWVTSVEVHEFCSVNDRPTPNCKECIRLVRFCKRNGVLDPVSYVSFVWEKLWATYELSLGSTLHPS